MEHSEPVTRHDVVLAARRHLADGGSTVLFGPRGVGKSYVLRGLVDGARDHAGTVLWSEPSAAERPLPYATLADLLDPLPDEELAALPPPQRAALRTVLRRQEPAGAEGPDPVGVRLGLLALLRGLTGRGPVLLAVDGAQCVDDPSAETLAYAARRLGPVRVRAVVTETAQSRAGPVVGAALCPGPVLVRELPAPAAPELREVLDRHTTRKLPYWLVRKVHEACDGDLLDALEIVRVLDRLPELPGRDQPLPVPERIGAEVAERLGRVAPVGRGLVLMASAVRKGPAPLALLRAASRTSVTDRGVAPPPATTGGAPETHPTDRGFEPRTSEDEPAPPLAYGELRSRPDEDDSEPRPTTDTPAPRPTNDTPAPPLAYGELRPRPAEGDSEPRPTTDTPAPRPTNDTPKPPPANDEPAPRPDEGGGRAPHAAARGGATPHGATAPRAAPGRAAPATGRTRPVRDTAAHAATGHPVPDSATRPGAGHPASGHPGAVLVPAAPDGLADRAIAQAVAAGLLVVDDDGATVRFAHPLYAAALYAGASAAERRTAHARLAAATLDPVEHARHLALAAPGPDEGLAAMLAGAAEQARRRGAPDDAAALAGLAALRTPACEPDLRCERLLSGAGYAYAAADYELCRELAERVTARAPEPAQHVRACVLIINAANQALHDLDEVFAAAFAHAGDDPGARARLHYLRGVKAHISDGDTPLAWAEAARAAALAQRGGDRTTELMALSLQAFTGTLQGRPDATEPLARALARPQDAGPTGGHNGPRAIKARLDFFADRLAEADAELERLVRRARQSDDAEETLFLLCSAIDVDVRAGRCGRALSAAHEALGLARALGANLGQVCYSAAVAEAAGGDLARAEALARESVRVARDEGDMVFLPLALCLLGQIQLRCTAPVAAVECLGQARTIARRRSIVDPAAVPWAADLAEALVAVGDHDRAREVVHEVRAAALRLDRAGVALSLLRADALLRAESSDLPGAAERLREAAAGHRELGLPLEWGRDLLVLGAVERRRRHASAALAAWQEATGVFRAADARPWLDQAHAEVHRVTCGRSAVARRAAGAPTAAGVTAAPGVSAGYAAGAEPGGHRPTAAGAPSAALPAGRWQALTPAEHRVAELVADGATNREIAGRLFLSTKTVESTLTRVYRKLGVRSRAELIRLRHAPEPTPDPAN